MPDDPLAPPPGQSEAELNTQAGHPFPDQLPLDLEEIEQLPELPSRYGPPRTPGQLDPDEADSCPATGDGRHRWELIEPPDWMVEETLTWTEEAWADWYDEHGRHCWACGQTDE